MTITEEDRDLLIGALETLGVALADKRHVWSNGERAIMEEACRILGATCEFHKRSAKE